MNKGIIISADDFGISRLASENILKLVEQGKVDRVEIMISKNISPIQVKQLLASGVALDVHLHLAKADLDFWQEHERKIENGAALRGLKFISRYVFGLTSVEKVEREWEKQIEMFVEIFGKVPDGVSSHEYIHFFPPYFRCVLRLCKKFNVSYIRFGKNNSQNYCAIAKILNWLRIKNLKKFKESALVSADYMLSFDWTNESNTFLKQLIPNVSVEIVFHPEKTREFDILAGFDKLK